MEKEHKCMENAWNMMELVVLGWIHMHCMHICISWLAKLAETMEHGLAKWARKCEIRIYIVLRAGIGCVAFSFEFPIHWYAQKARILTFRKGWFWTISGSTASQKL